MDDLISVIIPCFNVEKYINRCLESVLRQTYQRLEIILVDDGSTDCTGSICGRYSKENEKIKVIHKENGGASSARNLGMMHATGKYIGFVDSDDWISDDFYSYLYELMITYNADIAECGYRLMDTCKSTIVCSEEINILNNSELMDNFFRIRKEKSNYAVWKCLYKRKIVENIKFENGYINEDVLFSYFALLNVNCAVISNLPKYNYFVNGQGITRGALKKQDLSLYYVWDKIVEHTKEYNKKYYKKAALNRERATFTLLSKYVIYGINDYNIFTDRWVEEERGQLREAYGELMKSGYLDIKRKCALTLLCLSPQMLHIILAKVRKIVI